MSTYPADTLAAIHLSHSGAALVSDKLGAALLLERDASGSLKASATLNLGAAASALTSLLPVITNPAAKAILNSVTGALGSASLLIGTDTPPALVLGGAHDLGIADFAVDVGMTALQSVLTQVQFSPELSAALPLIQSLAGYAAAALGTPATLAGTVLRFVLDTVRTFPVEIPAGTPVTDGSGLSFLTTAAAVILPGFKTASIAAQASVAGAAGNAADHTLTVLLMAGLSVTNPSAASGGRDALPDLPWVGAVVQPFLTDVAFGGVSLSRAAQARMLEGLIGYVWRQAQRDGT